MDWKSAVAGTVLAAVGGAIGSLLTYSANERKMDIEMVRIALGLLANKTSDINGVTGADIAADELPIRDFALELLEQYTDVKIPNRDAWLKRGTLPHPDAWLRSGTLVYSAGGSVYSVPDSYIGSGSSQQRFPRNFQRQE